MEADILTCDQPAQSIDNAERVRAYEIAAYLSAASFPFHIEEGPPPEPVPSSDLTLNALVQHGVHRMDCDRAFLSLIDNRNQFICTEMTKHQSLAGPDPAYPLLLGTARIALEWGVCPYTMSVFQGKAVEIPETPYIAANKSYFCIKDFRQIPLFADRPYVAGYPRMVSYIETPLRSLSGHVIGSYCVVDNKTREFLHPEALDTLSEVTAAINSYLNMKRVEGSRTRSERMVDGLSQFLGSKRGTPFISYGATETSGVQTGPFDLDVFSQTSQMDSTSQLDNKAKPEKSPDERELAPCNPEDRANSPTSQQENASKLERLDLSTQIGILFSKVSHVIGYAMNSDGLTFFDATATGTQHRSSHLPSFSLDNESSHLVAHEDDPPAKILAEYSPGSIAEYRMVRQPRQSLIKRLTAEYPQGHVFAVDEHGVLDYDSDRTAGINEHSKGHSASQNEWKDLFECIPTARYVIFLPLWHYQRESCFATCLVWASSTGKTLDYGDINSLTAFGNSLMTEVFRLEAFTNSQSKSDFISSISHELRSPLHGILATVELMQEKVKEPKLVSMVDMIESCSSTLLDTFDHLLEFSKINSRASNGRHVEKGVTKHHSTNTYTSRTLVDLESLIEDLLEAVTLGHFSALHMESSLETGKGTLNDRGKEVPPESVIVTTYIENGRDWVVPIDKGAWKRILLNVFSNALKYTKSGHIDITLGMLEEPKGGPRYISVSVADTGVGMSAEFLKYHLFTPFMQENSLAPGTGLGLSIVKSIVDSIEGRISIDSRLHEGTRVTINVPLDQKPGIPNSSSINNNDSVAEGSLRGLTLGLLSMASDDDADPESKLRIVPPPQVLQRSIRNICEGRYGMIVADASTNALSKPDLVLIDTHAVMSTDKLDLERLIHANLPQVTANAVVTLGAPRKGMNKIFGVGEATCVTSPITRKKITVALLTALERANSKEKISSMSPPGFIEEGMLDEATQQTTQDQCNGDGSRILQEKNVNLLPNNSTEETTLSIRTEALAIASPLKSPLPQVAVPNENNEYLAIESRFRRLLLVDDNIINRKVLTAFAKRLDLPFSTAIDGAEAVRLYQKAALEEANPFDCVFMDISMPIMDGFQAVAAIRQFEKQQQESRNTSTSNDDESKSRPALRTYILALTGLGSEGARSQARSSGFDEFLLKPVKFKDIVPLLRANP
ncbi:Nn.00g008670.m01.CDS01 [Neocucurbitaria sp. VM-36]